MVYSLDELKAIIKPIAEKYNIRYVYVFGSYARNEADENSDVDILIDREGSKVKSLFDMGGLYNDLCEIFEKEVDLVTTQALKQDSTNERTPWFVDNVRQDAQCVYCKLMN